MEEREIKALQIAAKSKLTRKGNVWLVPSQTGHGEYEVNVGGLKNALVNVMDAAGGLRPERQNTRGELLSLNFCIHADGHVHLFPSFHLPGLVADTEVGQFVPLWCDLLGPEDRVLYSHHCRRSDPHGDPDAPSWVYRQLIPWFPETRAIVFRRGAEIFYKYEVAEAPPDLTVYAPKRLGNNEQSMRLEWEPSQSAAELTYLVRYSHDGGTTWRALAAGLREPCITVNLDLLPGGEDCRFQVVASSGIRTTVAETETYALPIKPVQAYILAPTPEASFREGEVVVCRGGGFSPNHQTTGFDERPLEFAS